METLTDGSIGEILSKSNVFVDMFDVMRIVDAEEGCLLETVDGQVCKTSVSCTDVFGSDERCRNCTSIRSFYTGEQVVKLEYVADTVLLIISVPISYGGRRAVAELVKDITKSMTVNIKSSNYRDDIAAMIDNLNTITVTDALTGLNNRRFIDERLPVAMQSCQAMGTPLSVAMLDVDLFKSINDTYGHQTGDLVLKNVAAAVQSFIRRKSDFAARYGGEEFLLCFPGVEIENCRSICEQLRKKIADTTIATDGGPINVTVSIGTAESTDAPNAAEAIALADKRMYEAKAAGRNRVV